MPLRKSFINAKDRKILEIIGQRVRDLRLSQEYTQTELGERADVHRTSIDRVENGHINVSLIYFLKIAKALNVAPSKLIDGTY